MSQKSLSMHLKNAGKELLNFLSDVIRGRIKIDFA